MIRLQVRIATRPFQGQLGILSKSGRTIVLENTNVILIAKYYRYYPAP